MEKYFKQIDGKRVNLIEHCSEILGKYPNAEILIGCDSQNHKQYTRYAVAVVFRYGISGAHYIFTIVKTDKIKDLFTRLFKECELSLEIANFITENTSYKVKAIELDFNNYTITKSTPLISATKGWCESLGYTVILKDGDKIASRAADKHCRKKKRDKK